MTIFSRFLIIFFCITLGLALYFSGVLRPVARIIEKRQTQALEYLSDSRFFLTDFFSSFKERSVLFEETRRLRRERDELLSKTVVLEAARQENEYLKKQLSYVPPADFERVAGAVIGKSIADPSLFLVSIGRTQGLKNSDPVLNQEGILLGRISKLGDSVSAVLPLSAVGSEIGIKIITGEKNYTAIVEGSHGLGLRALFLPLVAKIPAGSLVVTAGLEPGIPADLPIGRIGVVERTAGQLFQEASIVDFAVAEDTRHVFALIQPNEEGIE